MWKLLLLFAIVSLMTVDNVLAQPIVVSKPKYKEAKKFELSLEYKMNNTSIYYDKNGDKTNLI